MDKETLSNYGWIVICVLVLAVMLALATPFGAYIAEGFNSVKQGLFDTGDSTLDVGLNAVGVSNTLPCGHGRKEAGDHTQKECGHYNCQNTDCGCVPAVCGIEGHWSNDGKPHNTSISHIGFDGTHHTRKCQCVDGWTVPDGGTYYVRVDNNIAGDYTGAREVYNAGENFHARKNLTHMMCLYMEITNTATIKNMAELVGQQTTI